jgi:putative thioredoxin
MNFQQDVIDRSQEVPVVVDFWAPWCGPCRVLGPTIEGLAQEAEGSWELVKLNTEEHQAVAQQYQIMSIPAVKMFHRGEIIAEFTGALPRGHILKWLDEHLPNEEKLAYEELEQFLSQASSEDSLIALQKFVQSYPNHWPSRLRLASAYVMIDPDKSTALIQDLPPKAETMDAREDLQTLIRLQKWSSEEELPVVEKLKAAQVALENRDEEGAISLLIEAVGIDKKYADDLPRKASIAFFRTVWGNEHPLTKKHRILFNMALY